MKITKVSYQKTYSIGPYLTDRVGFEAEPSNDWVREDGKLEWETPEIILSRLENLADEWHKKEHPHLYQQEVKGFGDLPENQKTKVTFGPPPTIEYEKEPAPNYLTLIQEAPDLDALKSFKVIASSDPTKELYNAYNKRLKELIK